MTNTGNDSGSSLEELIHVMTSTGNDSGGTNTGNEQRLPRCLILLSSVY